MKKNRMMRMASVLLIAVLMTTSTISGTFAKYVTEVKSQDSARVAQWGWEAASMDLSDLFKNVYAANDLNGTDNTVVSGVDVIAPGTWGYSQFAFAYSQSTVSAPEVGYTFKVSTEESSCDDTIQDNGNIQWALVDGAVSALAEDYTWGSWESLIGNIKALSGEADGEKYYEAGTLPAEFTAADDVHTIVWRWKFHTDKDADVEDTGMGNAPALANVKLVITITATQVD